MEKINSYAKVNLGLEVVKKTKKNYHKLRMVMALIDLHDEISFKKNDDIIVKVDKDVCSMENNLCYKIAKYLKEKYNIDQGIEISIKKNIPDGGGLGGGSSNAAVVLKYLNKAWNLKLSKNQLKRIGFRFGCDIPFFIEGNISYVSGYGEKVKKIKTFDTESYVILIIPNFKNSTKEIFENHLITKRKKIKIFKLIKGLKKGAFKDCLFNELEGSADKCSGFKISNKINIVKNLGLKNTIMTGSGSTIVCYPDEHLDIDKSVLLIKKHLIDCEVIKSKIKLGE